ncbi:MAG: hypothetical protein FWH53_04045 [Leptospirales bacterium]|nr:hypothetical protein [Leptospirales bacterium]
MVKLNKIFSIFHFPFSSITSISNRRNFSFLAFFVLILSLMFSACGGDDANEIADTTINIAAINGVTIPVTGETPVIAITETTQYIGTVTWSPNDTSFAASTEYKATITLIPKGGYTLEGVTANFFTVDKATSVSNAANSGEITAVFPKTENTAATAINIAAINGVTIPVTGETPVIAITETMQYIGTVTWSPNDTSFKTSTEYTATITLTPKGGYTLQNVAVNFFTVYGATATNSANSGVITAVFPKTSGIEQGDGTSGKPFKVKDVNTLKKVGTNVDGWTLDAHYELTDDIDMSSATWKPIGDFDIDQLGDQLDGIDDIGAINDIVSALNFDSTFRGSFDGAGKKIKIGSTSDLPALFIAVGPDSTVKNLGLEDGGIVAVIFYGTIEDCYAADGIAGGNFWGTIKNCYVTGNVTGDVADEEVGAIAGFNFGTIENCYVTGNVTGNERVGGIVGTNCGAVENCYITGNVTGNDQVGGIVGTNIGMIKSCYATGDVTGTTSENGVGGIAGNNSGGTIENCYYAAGKVSGNHNVGGIVGLIFHGTIEKCYATGDITGNVQIGGMAGGHFFGTIENCYATGDIAGNENVGGIIGANSQSTIKNCYATGKVIANVKRVGGIAGADEDGTIENCVALNASVTATTVEVGRVVGTDNSGSTLSNNYAWDDMSGSIAQFTNKTSGGKDGADIAIWDPAWFESIGFTDSWWTDKLPTGP